MKLTLRPEWRPRPLQSFLGCVDIKTGVILALAFAMINKIAGVYGLIAVLTGAGGSAAQLSLYIYSVLGLAALVWGLRAITQEDAKYTLYFAHLFAADHVLSTAWTIFFAVMWWMYTPHDGRRQANSPAQEAMAQAGAAQAAKIHNMTQQEREIAAMELWNQEKGTATAVIVMGWFAKIYFALLIYSYALHLRKGSYRALPTTRASPQYRSTSALATLAEDDEEELPVDDFYRLPSHSPTNANPTHSRSHSVPYNTVRTQHIRTASNAGSSISSFADFVSAPGRSRRNNIGSMSKLNPAASAGRANGVAAPNGSAKDMDEMDEVLFDESEFGNGEGSSGGFASGSGSRTSGGESQDEEKSPFIGQGRRSSNSRA